MSNSATGRRPGCDVLVVVCERECFTAISELLTDVSEHKLPSGTLFDQGGIHGETDVPIQLALVEAGGQQVAALTKECLDALRPAYTFFVHLAAAIAPRVHISDVVVATDIYAFEYGEQGRDFRATPEVDKSTHRLVQRARSIARRIGWYDHLDPIKREEAPTAHIEPVASGRTRLRRHAPDLEVLRSNYSDAVATLWGGEDFIGSTHIDHIEAALICGISSELTVNGTTESPASRSSAARVAAAFARTMIEKLGADPGGRGHEPEVEPQIDEVDERRAQLAQRLDELMRIQEDEFLRRSPASRLAEIEAEIHLIRGQLRSGLGLYVGEFLRRRYRLIKEIGQGGFATVWHAYDRIDRENVALKVLHPNHGDNLETRDRFFRGARQMARLGGSGAVRVTNIGESDRGYHYFVMELLEGSFRDAIETGDIPLRERVQWVAQVARTLAAAHDDGIVHRDVRPDNILLDGRFRARLTDFDLVQLPKETRYTKQASMGDYVYAAPEQMRSASHASQSSDVYSLSMVLLFAILGAHPEPGHFQRDRYAFISALRCPSALKVILARALGYEPRDRYYEHAGHFELDIKRALEHSDWSGVQTREELRWKERAGKLRWLELAPEDAFAGLVAQVGEQTAWLPGLASRRGHALDLLKVIEMLNLEEYYKLPEAPLPAAPRDVQPPDWETAFETLCWADSDVFEAFLYLSGLGGNIANRRASRAQRASEVVDILTDPALANTSLIVESFRWSFPASHDGSGQDERGGASPRGPNWYRAKSRWIIGRMTGRLCTPLRDRFASLLATNDHRGIVDTLADPMHWEHEQLAIIPVAARLAHAVANTAADSEVFQRSECPDGATSFSVYRALCRLDPREFTELCEELVSPCLLPADNQAACAQELSRVYLERVCAYLLDRGKPVHPVGVTFLRGTANDAFQQLVIDAPDFIFEEMLLALNRSLHQDQSRSKKIAQLVELGEDRTLDAMRWLRADLLQICALPYHPYAEIELSPQRARAVFNALIRLSTDALLQIRDALALPSWMGVPSGTSRDSIAAELDRLLTWLALPGWTETVVRSEGGLALIIRWIESLRASHIGSGATG